MYSNLINGSGISIDLQNSESSDTFPSFRFIQTDFTNGPGGSINHTYGWGWNIDEKGFQQDITKPTLSWSLEPNYEQNGSIIEAYRTYTNPGNRVSTRLEAYGVNVTTDTIYFTDNCDQYLFENRPNPGRSIQFIGNSIGFNFLNEPIGYFNLIGMNRTDSIMTFVSFHRDPINNFNDWNFGGSLLVDSLSGAIATGISNSDPNTRLYIRAAQQDGITILVANSNRILGAGDLSNNMRLEVFHDGIHVENAIPTIGWSAGIGSSKLWQLGGDGIFQSNGYILTAVAPTVAFAQVGLGSTTSFTVGAAGGASALPATPMGYLIINVAGTNMKIPYYSA